MLVAICHQGSYPDWLLSVSKALRARKANPVSIQAQHDIRHNGVFQAGYLRAFGTSPYHHFQAAQQLQDAGTKFLNGPAAHEACHDKLSTQSVLQAKRISMPQVWEFTNPPPASSFPLICKPRYGSRGMGIILAHDLQQAQRHQQQLGKPCLMQSWITEGRCLRVIIGGGR